MRAVIANADHNANAPAINVWDATFPTVNVDPIVNVVKIANVELKMNNKPKRNRHDITILSRYYFSNLS